MAAIHSLNYYNNGNGKKVNGKENYGFHSCNDVRNDVRSIYLYIKIISASLFEFLGAFY